MLRLEPTNDKVDHLIQSGAGLIRAFRDQLRMEEANHRRECANRRKIHIGHLKLAGSDTIRDHLGDDGSAASRQRSSAWMCPHADGVATWGSADSCPHGDRGEPGASSRSAAPTLLFNSR
jgi:hypothetical protein